MQPPPLDDLRPVEGFALTQPGRAPALAFGSVG
jgi:hypothetical protein